MSICVAIRVPMSLLLLSLANDIGTYTSSLALNCLSVCLSLYRSLTLSLSSLCVYVYICVCVLCALYSRVFLNDSLISLV